MKQATVNGCVSRRIARHFHRRRSVLCKHMACSLALGLALGWIAGAHGREILVKPPGASTSTSTSTSTSAGGGTVYTSLTQAMAALQPGDHLVIASGVYREALLFPKRAWASDRPTIVEGNGTVQINGADIVTGWTALDQGTFYRHWEQEPAQVVVDDVQLQQIGGTVFDGYPTNPASEWAQQQTDAGGIWPGRKPGSADALPPGSFTFDASASRLYIRPKAGDLTGHVVQVSTRTYSAYGTGLTNVTLKNLSFQLGNTSIASRAGLVTLQGNHLVLDHVTVEHADSVGIELAGDDNAMRHVVANHCGQLGIKARGERVSIVDSETDFNNTRGFNKWWEAGGAKFIGDGGLRNSVVSAHTAIGNFGDGIWFDWENQGNRVEKSLSEYNTGFGIQYEASSAATIVNNVVVGNGQRGIYLPHSSNSVVAYNLVAGNALQGIAIIDEGRLDPDGRLDLRPRGNRIFANVLAWNGAALNLPATLRDNTSDSNVYIDDSAMSQWNLGWQTATSDSLPDWTHRTGQDRHSVHIQRAMDPLFRATLAEKKRMPDLTWYRTLRATLAPVPSKLAAQSVAGGAGDRLLTSNAGEASKLINTADVTNAMPTADGAVAPGGGASDARPGPAI